MSSLNNKSLAIAGLFYAQEVRYNASAWMHKSVYVQEVRYNAGAWMHKISKRFGYLQNNNMTKEEVVSRAGFEPAASSLGG